MSLVFVSDYIGNVVIIYKKNSCSPWGQQSNFLPLFCLSIESHSINILNVFGLTFLPLPGQSNFKKQKTRTASHRGDFVHHLRHERQAAGERANCDEGPGQLQAELAWNVTEGFELLHVSADTLHVRVAELILHVDQSKHALQKLRPEIR